MPSRMGTVVLPLLTSMLAGCAAGGAPRPGQPAPGFSVHLLDGRSVALADLRGKVVLLDFWATWCPPCRQELPHTQSMAADAALARRGLVVVAVDEGEDAGTVRGFLDRNRFTFPAALDVDGSVARDYAVSDLPTTVLIGRDGTVRGVVTGWTEQTAEAIEQAVDHALAENPR